MARNIWVKFKYILYIIIYIIATFIVAKIILLETLPDDGKCHYRETPLLIHYIFAAIITAAPLVTYLYTKDRMPKIKTKNNKL